ncbi:uncharacterized protein LOC126801142 isoform X2 [Argentina anserina]|uniref:uncharacterized protein LOC126801142 isoform X2 n=1 Tax=Argentina anserina TaxID=57926 RepID=UPI0021761DB1|nr:uncharacterized protein LOC126801142 isoform X2 [Potentilla anserina]
MSFQNQGFWVAKGTGGVNDGERLCGNSSTTEPKRSHQWFMDGPEVELFPNKKQAIEVPNTNLFSGLLNANVSPWGNAPSFQSFSGQFTERLFDSEGDRAVNFEDRNTSLGSEKMRKVNEDLFGNDSSFGLSMSHSLEDPGLSSNYGGFRKVKVSEVKDCENVMRVSAGHAYSQGDNDATLTPHVYKAEDNSGSMGLTYKKEDENFISMSDSFTRAENNFRSIGQPFTKGDEYTGICQPYKENNNTLLRSGVRNKGDSTIISIGETYNKADGSTMSTGHIYDKGGDISIGHDYSKVDSSMLSIGHSYNNGESTIISFGGCDDDDDDVNTSTISGYELMGRPFPKTEAMNEKDFGKLNATAFVNRPHIIAGAETVSRKKDDQKTSKKATSNNFPSNVRSLLSTGMLDGVPVKYIAWSREELQAVIKGSGYLCGCQSCNFSKVINAYEFERHASCKTKHPNNHIYFENGKTIYGIVQELRSTPQNMLFDVIQTITGSQINQKSFCLWKESFLAATRELQRIYGKGEVKQVS